MYLAVRYITSKQGWRIMLYLDIYRKQVMKNIFELLLGFPVTVGDDGIVTDEVCLFEEAVATLLKLSTENRQPNIILVLKQFLRDKMRIRRFIMVINHVLL